jgi:photosystem II stability/assembly factor-like uncharacterized protein
MKKTTYIILAIFLSFGIYFIQNNSKEKKLEIRKEKHAEYIKNHPYTKTLQLSKEERKAQGIAPNKYFEQEYLLEMNPKTGRTEPEKLFAIQEQLNSSDRNIPGAIDNMWEERGPRNVPGRTRALMFDPNDGTNKRVFAGGVSGGLWTNDDITIASTSWYQVAIPENLAISSITYDVNNSQNMFIGTGESYVNGNVNGNGIWRSTDGGATWEHIFGGSTGAAYFNGNTTLSVNSPAAIAGDYPGIKAGFGASTTSTIISDLVLVDDGSGNNEGCNTLTNAASINGHIAIVERGNCEFGTKSLNAQNAGATAVIIVNNVDGPPVGMAPGANGASVTIPVMMISKIDGQAIIAAMSSNTVNANYSFDTDGGVAITLEPGSFHINDIKTRNNGGTTEIYAALSDAYSDGSIMGSESFGLYKSVNNGDSWTKINLPINPDGHEYMINDIEFGADDKIWISTIKSMFYSDGGGTVLSSTDGVNFTVKYTIPGDADRTEIGISSTDANKIYLLAEHNADKVVIYKTTDGFATATELSKPNDADIYIPSNDFTRGQAFYDLMINVNPNNDEIVYVGGIDAFRSNNGGSSWSQISKWTNGNGQPGNISLVHADHHVLSFDPSNPDIAVLGTDGGVYYATSLASSVSSNVIRGRKWDYNTTQFYKGAIAQSTASEKLLAGAQDNGTQLMYNASAGINSSTRMQSGDGMYCFIDKDDQYMIASFYNNHFNRYSFSGAYQASLINSNDGDFVNPAELDDNLEILYTNGSTSATNRITRVRNVNTSPSTSYITSSLLRSGPTAFKISPYTTSSSKLFVGTRFGYLFKISNANTSATWSQIGDPNFFGSISAINFGSNENEIMVTFHNYGTVNVWYTSNGGTSWQKKEGDLPDIPVKDILMNPLRNNEVIIATNLGVWYTNNFFDSSPHWLRAENGMKDVKVTSFDIRTADNEVLASTYGRGLFTGYFDALPSSVEDSNILENSVSIYPTLINNSEVSIESSKQFGLTKIRIFDTQGKEVLSKNIKLGTVKKTIPINLNSGIYFIKLYNSGMEASRKLIVQ